MIAIDNQGCIIEQDKWGIYRVLNPDECPDKQFVKYLNCYDMMIKPPENRPKECR